MLTVKRVRACPVCKSTRIQHDSSNPLESAMGLPERFICLDCKHTANVFPTMPEKEVARYKKVRTSVQKEQVDVSYGTFEVRALWKATGPALTIVGVIGVLSNTVIGWICLIAGGVMTTITYGKKRSMRRQ